MDGSWLDRHRNVVFFALLGATLVGIALFYWRRPGQTPIEVVSVEATATSLPTATLVPSPTPTAAPLRVYITGAVVNSDVYFLPPGSIIKDIIVLAGGFTQDANPEGINQALELRDQQQIHVPRLGETDPLPPVQGGSNFSNLDSPNEAQSGSDKPATAGLINLNTANLEQLDSLPGIGPVTAQRIIDYRESAGPFTSIEQITEVSGIGEATFAKIRALIAIE